MIAVHRHYRSAAPVVSPPLLGQAKTNPETRLTAARPSGLGHPTARRPVRSRTAVELAPCARTRSGPQLAGEHRAARVHALRPARQTRRSAAPPPGLVAIHDHTRCSLRAIAWAAALWQIAAHQSRPARSAVSTVPCGPGTARRRSPSAHPERSSPPAAPQRVLSFPRWQRQRFDAAFPRFGAASPSPVAPAARV